MSSSSSTTRMCEAATRMSFNRGIPESSAFPIRKGDFPAGGHFLTASTAELAIRFVRLRTDAREHGEAPRHALSFTLIAVGTSYALLVLPTGRVDYAQASAAALLSSGLLALALFWSRVLRLATLGIPIG